jgi:hypothetical protein
MLSVVTISPASAPTIDRSPPPTASGSTATSLPEDLVQLNGGQVEARTLIRSVLVLIPASCLVAVVGDCGGILMSLARQATDAAVSVYFVYQPGNASDLPALAALTNRYASGAAQTVYDFNGRLFRDFQLAPSQVTALLVHDDATVDVRRLIVPGFDLTPDLSSLRGTH